MIEAGHSCGPLVPVAAITWHRKLKQGMTCSRDSGFAWSCQSVSSNKLVQMLMQVLCSAELASVCCNTLCRSNMQSHTYTVQKFQMPLRFSAASVNGIAAAKDFSATIFVQQYAWR